FATHYFELTQLAATHPQAVNLHLAAAEHRGGIAFLHEVRDGPASRSYGIQVARLAGMPSAVIRAADRILIELEARARADDDQLDLFMLADSGADDDASSPIPVAEPPTPADATAQAILARLRAVDPDGLSARAALELVYALRAELDAVDAGSRD
ncbi:MAG: DNA mismatch repair protein MutS, partial [Burkholderiaceae bacterium]